MSIVKKLVDQMMGTVEIDSQIGKGSVIKITLPIRVDKNWNQQPVNEEQDDQGDVAGMRVLLVEDNEINCEIAEYILREAGAEVVTVNNGKAAVDAFAASAAETFDLSLIHISEPTRPEP